MVISARDSAGDEVNVHRSASRLRLSVNASKDAVTEDESLRRFCTGVAECRTVIKETSFLKKEMEKGLWLTLSWMVINKRLLRGLSPRRSNEVTCEFFTYDSVAHSVSSYM